jgi:DNA replication protein DnaC
MAEDHYELIRDRYERKALLLTSGRALDEWTEALGNSLLASATLDRLARHGHTLVIHGQSYRQRERRKEDLTDHTPTRELTVDGAALAPWSTPR